MIDNIGEIETDIYIWIKSDEWMVFIYLNIELYRVKKGQVSGIHINKV